MGLLSCFSILEVISDDAERKLLEYFRLSHDILENEVECFIQYYVLFRSCRWQLLKII